MTKIILASRSPRRRELLTKITPAFEVMESHFDESKISGKTPEELVKSLSYGKAQAVSSMVKEQDVLVIGADTVVVSPQGEIFGIPQSEEEAGRMLLSLSGNMHTVMTGVTLIYGEVKESFVSRTSVYFAEITGEELTDYLRSGEPFDKAGGYGIQGRAAVFVKKIEGDYYNVVGLPVSELYHRMRRFLKV